MSCFWTDTEGLSQICPPDPAALRYLLLATEEGFKVVDAANGSLIDESPYGVGSLTVNAIDFSPDSSRVLITTNTGGGGAPNFYVYDLHSWEKESNPSSLPGGSLFGGAFSKDGERIFVTGGSPPYVHVYDAATKAKLTGPSIAAFNSDCLLTPDGSKLFVFAQSTSPYVRIYNTTTWETISPGSLPQFGHSGADVSRDGSMIARGYQYAPRVLIYDANYKLLATPASGPAAYGVVAFSPDGSLLAAKDVSSNIPGVWIYDTSDWTMAQRVNISEAPRFSSVRCLAFSNDGSILAAGIGEEPYLALFDTNTWERIPLTFSITSSFYKMRFLPEDWTP